MQGTSVNPEQLDGCVRHFDRSLVYPSFFFTPFFIASEDGLVFLELKNNTLDRKSTSTSLRE